jgi:hypothetical protein
MKHVLPTCDSPKTTISSTASTMSAGKGQSGKVLIVVDHGEDVQMSNDEHVRD